MYGLEPAPAEPVEHGPLVAAIAAFLRPALYVELGAYQCATLVRVAIASPGSRCVGVDLKAQSVPLPGNASLVQADTREWLSAQPADSIDMAFLDSSHELIQTMEECELLNVKVRRNGVILLHDVYPPNEQQLGAGYCGDVHLAVQFLRENLGWEFATLPAQHGLAVCRRTDGRQLLWR